MALKFNPFTGNFDIIKDPVFDVLSISSATTVSSNKTYMVSGTAYTITLPASPQTNDYIILKDSAGNAYSNNKTIAGNGNNIDGSSSILLDSDYGSAHLVFDGDNWFRL